MGTAKGKVVKAKANVNNAGKQQKNKNKPNVHVNKPSPSSMKESPVKKNKSPGKASLNKESTSPPAKESLQNKQQVKVGDKKSPEKKVVGNTPKSDTPNEETVTKRQKQRQKTREKRLALKEKLSKVKDGLLNTDIVNVENINKKVEAIQSKSEPLTTTGKRRLRELQKIKRLAEGKPGADKAKDNSTKPVASKSAKRRGRRGTHLNKDVEDQKLQNEIWENDTKKSENRLQEVHSKKNKNNLKKNAKALQSSKPQDSDQESDYEVEHMIKADKVTKKLSAKVSLDSEAESDDDQSDVEMEVDAEDENDKSKDGDDSDEDDTNDETNEGEESDEADEDNESDEADEDNESDEADEDNESDEVDENIKANVDSMEVDEHTNKNKSDTNKKMQNKKKLNLINKVEGKDNPEKPIKKEKPKQEPSEKIKALVKKDSRYVVFVGNLPYTVQKTTLQEHFAKAGKIRDIRIALEKGTNRPRGFAFVEMSDTESYEKAFSLHNTMIEGRRINVLYTQPGHKKSDEKKKQVKAKNFKLGAMRKQGQLAGSTKPGQNRNEEKKIIERKRNILYLIANYLQENGFRVSSECIVEEGQLTDAYQICDNVDLDTILQEYESYYYLKFHKQPRIIKKCASLKKENPNPNVAVESKFKKPKRTTDNIKVSNSATVKVGEKIDKSPSTSVKVTSLSSPSSTTENVKNSEGLNSNIETPLERSTSIRPLRDFAGFTSDWREMAEVISREIITVDLNVKWDDIQGHDHAKSLLIESVIYPSLYPYLFRGLLAPWRGILLHGPPGAGKTLLAKAVASQTKAVFFNVSASCLISKWRGDSEKLVRVLFDLARHNAPSIIFLDEVEAVSSHRDSPSEHEASRRFKSELLRQLDGIQDNRDAHVLLLATTNLPWELDSAMLRRLEKRVHINLPDEHTRYMIIEKLLPNSKKWAFDEMKEILDRTIGYSGSDIQLICKEAAMNVLRETLKKIGLNNISKGGNVACNTIDLSGITAKELTQIITRVKPTANHLQEKHKKWASEFGST